MASNNTLNKALLAELEERQLFTESLQSALNIKNKIIQKVTVELKELNDKYKETLFNYNLYKIKYRDIEEDNENYIKLLENGMEQLIEKLKHQENLNKNLMEQLNEVEIDYQQLYDKSITQAECIEKFQTQLLECDMGVENLKSSYIMQLKVTQSKAHELINLLRSDIGKTKKELQEFFITMDSTIKEKFQIIMEYLYKICEMDQLLEQHAKHSPNLIIDKENNNATRFNYKEYKMQHSATPQIALSCNNDIKNFENTKEMIRKRCFLSSVNTSNVVHIINQSNQSNDYDHFKNYDNNDNFDNHKMCMMDHYSMVIVTFVLLVVLVASIGIIIFAEINKNIS